MTGRIGTIYHLTRAAGARTVRAAVLSWAVVTPDSPAPLQPDGGACRQFLDTVSRFAQVHAVKLYRMPDALPDGVPQLPCLDHEARLHENIAPHAAMYIEDRDGGGLHEVVWVPDRRRIEIDVVSTADEHTAAAHARLVERLTTGFPGHRVQINGPSWLRGDRRVSRACRAQVSLRDVLAGTDFRRLERALERLGTIGELMEKESRVASWSVRTVTGPLLAVAGFLSYGLIGQLTPQVGEDWVQGLRYVVVGGLGAVFLYFGLKAVHLTEMANRVWKRRAEYGLILAERRKIAENAAPPATPASAPAAGEI